LSDFENIACKVMGIILIILLSFLSFQLMGCSIPTHGTTVGWTDGGAPIVRSLSSFPLLDNRDILHEYKSDAKTYKRITHPSTDKLTLYCAVHFQWETVNIVWKRSNLTNIGHREESSFWRWTYMVSRNKKQ
jgi:hypothetical protein